MQVFCSSSKWVSMNGKLQGFPPSVAPQVLQGKVVLNILLWEKKNKTSCFFHNLLWSKDTFCLTDKDVSFVCNPFECFLQMVIEGNKIVKLSILFDDINVLRKKYLKLASNNCHKNSETRKMVTILLNKYSFFIGLFQRSIVLFQSLIFYMSILCSE